MSRYIKLLLAAVVNLVLLVGCFKPTALTHRDRAYAACTRSDTATAIREYQVALMQAPGDKCLLINLISCARKAKQFDVVEAALKELRIADGESYDYFHQLGTLEYKRGHYHAARVSFARAIALNSQPLDHYYLGRIFERLNDLENAKAQYRISINLYRTLGELSADEWANRAYAARVTGDTEDSEHSIKSCLGADANNERCNSLARQFFPNILSH